MAHMFLSVRPVTCCHCIA